MYNKSHKMNFLDANEGYNVKLKSSLLGAIIYWGCTLFFINYLIYFISNGIKDVISTKTFCFLLFCFLLSIVIVLFFSIFYTLSYVKKRHDYLRITKEGMEFLQYSSSKRSTEKKIPWNKITEISIYPHPPASMRDPDAFTYDMCISSSRGLNTFSLHWSWSLRLLVIVRILKDYSSNKIKIKVEKLFNSNPQYY